MLANPFFFLPSFGAEGQNRTADTGISSPMLPRLLPLKDAASYLGLTVWGIRERIWAGQLPVVTFPNGRKQYIDTQDLETFIQGNKRTIT